MSAGPRAGAWLITLLCLALLSASANADATIAGGAPHAMGCDLVHTCSDASTHCPSAVHSAVSCAAPAAGAAAPATQAIAHPAPAGTAAPVPPDPAAYDDPCLRGPLRPPRLS